jgi:outer membrane protein TolC
MRKNKVKDARRCFVHSSAGSLVLCLLCFLVWPSTGSAQLSFASAIRLSLENSPRVRAAQIDLKKAQQNLAVAKDIFVPSVVTGGGLGWTSGITLTVPTIFTVGAQSLVYSNQQRFAIRAAHADIEAAQFALEDARQQTEEDAAITCLALAQSQSVRNALEQQHDFALKLVSILEDRVHAGLDSELDLKKARRGVLQIELQQMQVEDDEISLRSHLAELTAMSFENASIDPGGIPSIPSAQTATEPSGMPPGILAAEATQRGKLARARGDAGYTWRPIITFGAQYGRVSPINNVSSFYNLHGNYNTANIGLQFSFPMLDKVRRDAARGSLLDAARSALDVANQRAEETVNLGKMQRSIRQVEISAELAQLDYGIAQDELKSATIEQHASSGAAPLTPKEEQNAHLQERQKYLDLLNTRLQLNKAKVSLLRQTRKLDPWLHSLLTSATAP